MAGTPLYGTIMPMVIVLALRWWYGAGWQWAWQRSVVQRVAWCVEAFSLSQLAKTWLSPFKQTYTRGRKGSIDTRIQSMIDNLVSRIIGSLARTLIICAGLLCIVLSMLSGLVIMVLWPLVPLLPVAGTVMTVSGVTL